MTLLQIQEPQATITNESKIAIGIDLGTTNSLISIFKDGKPHIIKNREGENLTPSVVAYGQNPIVGEKAWSFVQKDPKLIVSSIKRFMGKPFGQVTSSALTLDTTPEGALAIRIHDTLKTPTEVSADILRYLKTDAERFLGEPIEHAVITVPAYFSEAARNATKDAAELAGFNVLRLLNEPTAAAIAYGLDQGEEGTYLVYDLGGGTFDVSVLHLRKGVFQVLSTNGDTHLGGDDMDIAIVRQFWNLTELSPTDFKAAMLQTRTLKEQLSHQPEVSGTILNRDVSINVKDLNRWIEPLVDRTLQICQQALLDAGIYQDAYTNLKGIILVGGATRIPLIQKKLTTLFGKQPLCTLNPDEVVAKGAAIQADALMGNQHHVLLDVTPLSLGIETMGGIVEKIIHRNTPIPCQAFQDFATFQDGQTAMTIHVVQGEREMVKDCVSLAKFTLKGIPSLPAGDAHVRIQFQLDADGLPSVTAKELKTNISQHIIVKPSYGLSSDKVLEMLKESFEYGADDLAAKSLASLRLDVVRLGKLVNKTLKADTLLWNQKEYETLLADIQTIQHKIEKGEREILEESHTELQQILNKIIQHRIKQKLEKVS